MRRITPYDRAMTTSDFPPLSRPATVLPHAWVSAGPSAVPHVMSHAVGRIGDLGLWLVTTGDVSMTPNTGDLPGGAFLQKMMDGLQGWALALSLIGLVIGAAAWALGSHAQNYQQSFVGRKAVLISGLAALLIGAGPTIVNFFFHAGQGIAAPLGLPG